MKNIPQGQTAMLNQTPLLLCPHEAVWARTGLISLIWDPLGSRKDDKPFKDQILDLKS